MDLKPGSRWKSAACETEVVIVRPPKAPGVLECGGASMLAHGVDRPGDVALLSEHASGSLVGKRYADEASGIEVLCTKAGQGALVFSGATLIVRETKKLPSSD